MKLINLLNAGSSFLQQNNISSYQLDTELLLSKVMKKRREELLMSLNTLVNYEKIKKFNYFIKRRSNKEPVAYILNEKEFWSKNFYVNQNTLVPRPETELMVEKLVKIFKNRKINLLDIGTGSGCIIISLLTELKTSKGVGLDISKKALDIAKINSKRHKLLRKIKFLNLSFSKLYNQKFDLVVSNPPYIKSSDLKNLDCDVKNFEPKIALDGGNDGLDLIKKVIYKTRGLLKKRGIFALEIGYGQYEKVSKILKSTKFRIEYIVKDYNDNIRCIISRNID